MFNIIGHQGDESQKKSQWGEFPGGPVVRTAEGPGWIPGQGTKVPQAVLHPPHKIAQWDIALHPLEWL